MVVMGWRARLGDGFQARQLAHDLKRSPVLPDDSFEIGLRG